MTVYVDDASIPATAGRNSSRWSHLFADSQEELHTFAAQLGLRREWFQPGSPVAGQPSPFWHYDVTAGKRAQAIRLGATPVPWRDSARIIRDRETRSAEASCPSAPLLDRGQQGGCGAGALQAVAGERVHPADADSSALADQADHVAGLAYRAGDTRRAAQLIATAMRLDPARGHLWNRRLALLGASAPQPDDKPDAAIDFIREWNQARLSDGTLLVPCADGRVPAEWRPYLDAAYADGREVIWLTPPGVRPEYSLPAAVGSARPGSRLTPQAEPGLEMS
jgi:hypothetical protein